MGGRNRPLHSKPQTVKDVTKVSSAKLRWRTGGDASGRKGRCNVSWHASDAVWRMFDRKQNAREFLMMLSMAHPSLATSAEEVHCSRRWAIKLRNSLVANGDLRIIEKGRGRGNSTAYGLHPKYSEKVNSITSPFNKQKVNSGNGKGELSCARKGEQPARRNVHESNKTKKKVSAAAALALAGPPPPLRWEPELDTEAIAKFQADFERSRGRKLLGAN